jgi:hypothetical protein
VPNQKCDRVHSEHGAVSIVLAAVVGLTSLMVLGVGRLGAASAAAAHAQAVADLVALAGTTAGTEGINEVATRNDAVVESVAGPSGSLQRVEVRIRAQGVTGVAAAELGSDTVVRPSRR